MADTTTTNLSLTKPELDVSTNWGQKLNANLDALDAIFSATGTGVSLNIDGGDIASAVTINKSPVITLGGDLTGNVTLTNLASGTLTASLVAESVQDIVGPMFSSNTETGITVAYEDSDGTIDLSVGVDDSSIEVGASNNTLNVKALGITNAMLAGSIANSKLANSSITVSDGSNTTATALGGTITFSGTSNEVEVAESSGTITIGLPAATEITTSLGVGGGSTNGVQISQGAIAIKNGGTQSYIDFYCESSNAHYARLQAPAHSAFGGNITLTLPATTGTLALTSGDITGNAATATALATARTIHGVSFDGTANIDLTEVIQDTVGAMVSSNTESGITVAYEDGDGTLDFTVGTLNQDTTGTAALATQVTISANNSTDETIFPVFVDGATGSQGLETDTGFTYNPSTGLLTATGFSGNLTGTLQTAAQTNVTSVGTLSSLTVSGDVTVDTNTLKVDSSNNRVGVLNASPDVTLDVGSATDAIHVPVGTTAQRPTGAAGYFRYNSTTGGFEGYTDSWGAIAGGGGGSSSTFAKNTFAGDGSTTAFTLTTSMTNEDGLIVFIDGVYQADNVYSVSGTTLTFATAPVNGRVIEVFQLEGGIVGVAPVIATMTGDGSDTTLALGTSPDSENQTFVTIDGVVQHKDTYSISGSTLTFSAAPPNGTKVEAIIFNNVSVATFQDADGDTKIQLEESTDEDTIRMDIAGTEVLTLTNSAMTLKGTTPTLTIGDAGAEDTKIVFDGNAQDYYVGLDDSDDELKIGLGSAVGTTPAISINASQNLELGGTMNFLGFKGPTTNFTTGTLSSAVSNTGFGYNVFNVLTSGTNNVGMGQEALKSLTSGIHNIAIGSDAMAQNTIGFQNTVMGSFALDGAVAASRNTALGYAALSGVTAASATDTENTAVGGGALQVLTSGTKNTAIGRDAGLSASTGDNNTFVGSNAGGSITTGGGNVFVGQDAGTSGEASVTNNTCIYVGPSASGNNGASNEYVIGQGRIGLGGNSFAFGKASNVVHNVFTSNATFTRNSDLHKKTNIKNTDIGLSFINELQPVTFNWRPNNEFPKHYKDYSETENHMETDINLYGMIAQDVEKALKKVGHKNFGGWSEDTDGSQRLAQSMFIYPLINAVKELSEKCDSLQKEINELKGN
jgi:hypothetical protein